MNGRFTYSGDTHNVNHFNETFTGLNSRTIAYQEIRDTGALGNGRKLAHNKRVERQRRLRDGGGAEQVSLAFPMRSTSGISETPATR